MSWSDYAALPNSKKIVLVELDINTENTFWTNWAPYTWFFDFEAIYPDLASFLTDGTAELNIQNVGSISVDGIQLNSVASIDTCVGQNSSYYYDSQDRRIYVRLANNDDPSWHHVEVGNIFGISNHRIAGQTGYGENPRIYEPRLFAAPSIGARKDPQFFGKISFDTASIVVLNDDGFYDDWGEDNNIFGNICRVYIGFDDQAYADFRQLFEGMIGRVRISDRLSLEVLDKRAKLSRKIPVNKFQSTTYTSIKYSNLGAPLPLAFGTLKNIPLVVTNETETSPSNYVCFVADTSLREISTVESVYVNDIAVGIESTSLSGGTVTISAGNSIEDGVTADIEGYVNTAGSVITNSLEIARLLLTDYFDIAYTSDYFNTTEWNSAESAARDICLYIDRRIDVIEAIEEIANTEQGYFVVQDDGLYSFYKYDSTASATRTIKREEYFEDVPMIEYDPTEVLTSIVVNYQKNWSSEAYAAFRDASQENDNFFAYSTYLEKEFDTLLPDDTDVQDFADTQMSISGQVLRLVTITTKMQHADIEIGDMVNIELERVGGDMIGTHKAEVIEVRRNLDEMMVSLTLRLVAAA